MELEIALQALALMALCFIQNIAFTLTSRSRNRNHKMYHCICAIFSNGIFLATLSILIASQVSLEMVIPYIMGTVSGSLVGAEIAIKIEKKIGATT